MNQHSPLNFHQNGISTLKAANHHIVLAPFCVKTIDNVVDQNPRRSEVPEILKPVHLGLTTMRSHEDHILIYSISQK